MAQPVFVVHSLAHAEAALAAAEEAGAAVVLLSPRDGARVAGAGYFKALIEQAGRAHAGARFRFRLDCGDDGAAALGALRIGIGEIVFGGRRDVARRIGEIASRRGARMLRPRDAGRRHGLDLLEIADPLEACRARLARRGAARD